jgi:DNA phosphorothioation-dependent restriction protein DptG
MDLIFKNLPIKNIDEKKSNLETSSSVISEINKPRENKTENKEKKTSTENVKKFIERNKEKLKEKKTCHICQGTYTHFNKYSHNKTKRHLLFLNLNNKTQ